MNTMKILRSKRVLREKKAASRGLMAEVEKPSHKVRIWKADQINIKAELSVSNQTRMVAGAMPVALVKAVIIPDSAPVPVRMAVSDRLPAPTDPVPPLGTVTVDPVPPEAR